MEAGALVRRLKETYFQKVIDDPIEAHMNLFTCMQDLICEVQNNRRSPEDLRETARILRLVWDHDYRSTMIRENIEQGRSRNEFIERLRVDQVANLREVYPEYLDPSGARGPSYDPYDSVQRDAPDQGQEPFIPEEAPSYRGVGYGGGEPERGPSYTL